METQTQLFKRIGESQIIDQDIQDKLGVTRQTVYNWRMGKTDLKLQQAVDLHNLLKRFK